MLVVEVEFICELNFRSCNLRFKHSKLKRNMPDLKIFGNHAKLDPSPGVIGLKRLKTQKHSVTILKFS